MAIFWHCYAGPCIRSQVLLEPRVYISIAWHLGMPDTSPLLMRPPSSVGALPVQSRALRWSSWPLSSRPSWPLFRRKVPSRPSAVTSFILEFLVLHRSIWTKHVRIELSSRFQFAPFNSFVHVCSDTWPYFYASYRAMQALLVGLPSLSALSFLGKNILARELLDRLWWQPGSTSLFNWSSLARVPEQMGNIQI